jgi:hypothetical protein
MLHVLRSISTFDLFTDSPSYINSRNNTENIIQSDKRHFNEWNYT